MSLIGAVKGEITVVKCRYHIQSSPGGSVFSQKNVKRKKKFSASVVVLIIDVLCRGRLFWLLLQSKSESGVLKKLPELWNQKRR